MDPQELAKPLPFTNEPKPMTLLDIAQKAPLNMPIMKAMVNSFFVAAALEPLLKAEYPDMAQEQIDDLLFDYTVLCGVSEKYHPALEEAGINTHPPERSRPHDNKGRTIFKI